MNVYKIFANLIFLIEYVKFFGEFMNNVIHKDIFTL